MMRTGRILLVEPEEKLRDDLDRRLAEAGHDVASVPDDRRAALLLEEGLQPDVVVAAAVREERTCPLRDLAPGAIHLRIDRDRRASRDFLGSDAGVTRCSADPGDVLRRVEEVLLRHTLPASTDESALCLDLARRLTNALPSASTPEDRIELLTEGFHAFFGVRGTLVIRRGPGTEEWIEVRQDLDDDVAARISAEIARRTIQRSIRPFLTRIRGSGEVHQVACIAVQLGERETDLALDLERAPSEPQLREALMNLVGSAVRSADTMEKLTRVETLVESQGCGLEALLAMSLDFTSVTHRGVLCERILGALRREVLMPRSAVFLPREGGEGLLSLQAASGFSGALLDRIGLSSFHGIGRECFEAGEIRMLAELRREGAVVRERRMLAEAGLQWVAPIAVGDRPLGLLFFGGKDEEPRLEAWERRTLRALLGSAALALRALERVEELQRLCVGGLRSLAAAAELREPADAGHSERVARGAVLLGRAIGLSGEELRELTYSAVLHDVGKIGAPPAEDGHPRGRRDRMHPVVATRILSKARPPADVVQGVEQHHERYDGLGFPYGLRGSGIHVFGRILAIANAFDRLTNGPGPVLSTRDALHRLELGAGILFDPGLVALFAGEMGRNPGRSPGSLDELWLEEVAGAS